MFEITDDFVRVTIPFAYERFFGTQVVEQKTEQKNLTQPERIKQIIFSEMENNPSITTMQLMNITGLKKTSIQNYIRELTSKGIIERVGGKKGGIWKVNK
ncbi:MAG: winged helix-turn-helix transcriptional regulator [Clostridia bacterium]|nr:winged helix-turn-helix transcriptional regulator [Clostridia bacterium]